MIRILSTCVSLYNYRLPWHFLHLAFTFVHGMEKYRLPRPILYILSRESYKVCWFSIAAIKFIVVHSESTYIICIARQKKGINVSTLQIKESMLEATQGIGGKEITTHDDYWIIIYVSHMTWIVSHNLKLGSFHWGKNVIVVSNIFLVSSFLILSCLLVRIYTKSRFSEQRKTNPHLFPNISFQSISPRNIPQPGLKTRLMENPGASFDSLLVPLFLLQVVHTSRFHCRYDKYPRVSLMSFKVLKSSASAY